MAAIPLAEIKDPGSQMRVEKLRAETVDEYAEAMLRGDEFPPVPVFYDGRVYWLGDGFHRVDAARKIERETIEAEIRTGTERDAILYAVGANATHGLQRTQADKRNAINRMLDDPEWQRWSDRKIAEATRTDHKTVAKVRRERSGEIPTAKSTAKPELEAGEFPKEKSTAKPELEGWEIPKKHEELKREADALGLELKRSALPADSLVIELLASLSDSDLLGECDRRGFELKERD